MWSDREADVERICHIALDTDPASRGVFLDEACGTDTALRLEVENLLAHEAAAERFLASSALHVTARGMIGEALTVGRQIGSYRVVARLGAGAMGEVYRAHDLKLGRDVALKVLPLAFVADRDRLTRFEREARALAALNHRHIAAIYQLEEADGIRALVLELVEGDTLDDRLARPTDRRLPLPEVLVIAGQIAAALEAAHEKGIVHRDLKPANIKITPDGCVKVLDFGLARMGAAAECPTPVLPSVEPHATLDGTLLGTPAYMSPEQAIGQPVDPRTDLWALGVILHEMTTGKRPFDGPTSAAIFQALLGSEPVRVREQHPDVPIDLASIIDRLLLRDRDARYQSAKNVCGDLARVIASSRKRYVVPALALTAVAVLAIAAPRFLEWTHRPVTLPSEYTQITDFTDSATAPALSPDGRMAAFIRGGEAFLSHGQIYVRVLSTGETVRLTNNGNRKYAPVFTPDGSRVAYSELSRTGTVTSWDTWTVPVSGGEPSRLLPNATGLVWLDRRQVMFSAFKGKTAHLGIVTATDTRAAEREIYFPAHERGMAHYSYLSPDRQMVLVVEMDRTGTFRSCRLVPFDGRSTGRLVGPQGNCRSAAWSPDGKWMYFGADVDGHSHVWRQAYAGGSPEQITFGPTEEEGVAVAPDGRSLVTSIGRRQSAIWIHDRAGDRPISSEGFAHSPEFSSDGRRVYYLLRASPDSHNNELRSIDLTSGRVESVLAGMRITENDMSLGDYDISRDGQEVVWSSKQPDGTSAIWLARLDRRTPPREIARDAEYVSFGTHDDLLFVTLGKETSYLTRIMKDGTGRTRISDVSPIYNKGGISPDGEWAIVYSPVTSRDAPLGTVAVPIRGGRSKSICSGLCYAWWSSDGKFLYASVFDESSPELTVVVPVQAGHMVPDVPEAGLNIRANQTAIPGSRVIEQARVVPGPDSSSYVFVKTELQRNLYRVPIH